MRPRSSQASLQFQVLQQAALFERQLRRRQAERRDVPADQLRFRCQVQQKAVFGPATAVADRLQRQPLAAGPRIEPDARALHRRLAEGAVETRRAGRGHQRVAARARTHGDLQRVAADQAAGRMHQHVVRDRIAFGVQRLQHAQRAVVLGARHAATVLQPIVQCQPRVPGHVNAPARCPGAHGPLPAHRRAGWRVSGKMNGAWEAGWLPSGEARSGPAMVTPAPAHGARSCVTRPQPPAGACDHAA